MLTPKQNLLETLKKDGKPECLCNSLTMFRTIPGDPCFKLLRGNRVRGTNSYDQWGTYIMFPEDAPAAVPYVTEENQVIKDITEWKKYVKVPDLAGKCAEGWEEALEAKNKIDQDKYLTMVVMGTGIFEQLHMLMTFEDTLVNFLLEPEAMHELVDYITDWELAYAAEICKYLKPDAIFHHDDWGSQQSSFLSVDMFREYYLDAYKKVYGYYKDHGVQLIVHHSDSYAANLVPSMIEMGIDIWQGVMSTNNIPELIKEYGGQITFMGGIDSGKVDKPDWTRENIAKVVEEACQANGTKYYIPCNTMGGPESIYPGVYEAISEEIAKVSDRIFK